MSESRGRVRTMSHRRRDLLGELRLFDDGLDVLLLGLPLFIVAPPHGPLVFALETKVFAGLAHWLAFVTFLSS
jgi:hypothetical protein